MSEDIKWVTRNRKLKEDTHTKTMSKEKRQKRQRDLRKWFKKKHLNWLRTVTKVRRNREESSVVDLVIVTFCY